MASVIKRNLEAIVGTGLILLLFLTFSFF